MITAEQHTLTYSKPLVWFAKTISYLFHPLFIPTYIFLLLVMVFPYEFSGFDIRIIKLKVFSVFWMTAFFPAFGVFLMYKLKFIDSIFLHTQKERIIPFFITMFFYWWMYYLSRNFADQPIVLKFFYFGIFISTSIGVIINNFMKISLHGLAMGGATTAIILFAWYYKTNLSLIVIIAVILTGLVASCRFIAGEHTNKEMFVGIFVGAICQIVGYWFVGI